MPNHSIHAKYSRLAGVPNKIAHVVDSWIDRPSNHDPWRHYVVREEVLRDRHNNTVVCYKLRRRDLVEELWKPMTYLGKEGLRALILHIILDILESIIRPKTHDIIKQHIKWIIGQRYWYYIQFCDFQHYIDDLLEEVINFVRQHLNEVKKDLEAYELEKDRGYPTNIIYEIYTVKC